MMDYVTHGQDLLRDWYLYRSARPKEHVLDIQKDKDDLQRWASLLQTTLLWEADATRIAETCNQFESRLKSFKEKIVIEILKGGSA